VNLSLEMMLFSFSSQVPIWKSSHPAGPGAVDVEDVVGGVGCEVVEDGFGPGGQGQVDRSGSVGPLVQPSQCS